MTVDARPTGDDFSPPRWLRNRHVQSIYASLPLRRLQVQRAARGFAAVSQPLVVDCGEGVRLLALQASQPENRPGPRELAILLHGWEGSANSLYVTSLGQTLYARGLDVVRLNLRDHGGSHDLNPELFHSCRIDEVVGAVRRLHELHPRHRLSVAGFSLGGNFALRVAVRARRAQIDLAQAVAVCPVLDPAHTLAALEHGWSLYSRYFIGAWRRSLRRKHAAWPGRFHFDEMLRIDSLTEMTAQLVRRYTDYRDLDEYLRGYALVDGALAHLHVPSRLIAANDDPIIPAADLDRLSRTPALTLTRTPFGGHCGYYDGQTGARWLERTICAALLGAEPA
jgi:predicted alpha/beta-fold hydrolase